MDFVQVKNHETFFKLLYYYYHLQIILLNYLHAFMFLRFIIHLT